MRFGRRGPSFFWIFILLIVFGTTLIDAIMPLLFMGLFGYGIYKLIELILDKGEKKEKNNKKENKNTFNQEYKNSTVRSNKSSSYVSNVNNREIDKVLSQYFKKNVSLILFDDISIDLQGGTYTTVDNLYIAYKGEKICQLKEYKAYYPETYQKVIDALAKLSKKSIKAEEEKKKKANEPEKEKEVKIESFSEAEKFINEINSLNQGILNEEISNGLTQTCELLKQIDIVDKEDGTVDPKLNKLYEYYLPILTGILKDYKRLYDSPIKGEEFKKCETQLIKTIKLINEALKTIYSSLHEADYMNLNADINTLQSLLKQDGLVESPFGEDN